MARGILGKAMRGAAAVGVPAALEEHRARIMAQRDERLHVKDMEKMAGQQEYQTSERIAGQEFTAERDDVKLQYDAELERQKAQDKLDAEDRSHTRAKELIDYRAEVAGERGGADTANMKDVKAMVEAGVFESEKEAWEALKDTTKIVDVMRFTNLLSRDQEARSIYPENEGYKSPRELFEEAKQAVAASRQTPGNTSANAQTPAMGADTDVAKPMSQMEFDALPSGTRYINPTDGAEYIKN